jgi:hypothetical protein
MYDWMRYISFISPEETHRHPHHHPHLPDLMVHASAFKPSVGVLTPFNPSVGVLTHAMEIQELQAGFASRRTYIHVYIIYTYIYIYIYIYIYLFICIRPCYCMLHAKLLFLRSYVLDALLLLLLLPPPSSCSSSSSCAMVLIIRPAREEHHHGKESVLPSRGGQRPP